MTRTREFAKLISQLGAMFRVDVDAVLISSYAEGLDDIPMDALQRAVKRSIRECTFMPKVVDLRAMAGGGSPEEVASQAWVKVFGSIGAIGHRRSVDFGAVGNAAVREIGGWGNLCRMQQADVPFRRRDFIAAYTAATRVDCLGERGRSLAGSCSSDGAEPVRVQLEPAPQRPMLTSGEVM